MYDRLDEAMTALDSLLEKERSSLLVGDLDALNGFQEDKRELVRLIESGDAREFQENLRYLQHKVERNQALLDGALSGIKSVTRRLNTVRRVRQSLEFYGSDGKKSSVNIGVERSVEKRT